MDTTKGSMSSSQRGKLFAEMKKMGMELETLEESVGFGASELSVQEASKLIDAFMAYQRVDVPSGTKDEFLRHTIEDVGKMHDQQDGTHGSKNPAKETKQESVEEKEKEKEEKKKDLMERNGATAMKKSEEHQPQPTDMVHVGDLELSMSQLQGLANLPQFLNHIYRKIMQQGTDYGVIEGTNKPTLFKPGAELLRLAFRLSYRTEVSGVENYEKGFFAYRAKLTFFDPAGKEMGTGEGSCNNGETRYASRWVTASKVPVDVDPKTLKSKKYSGANGEYTKYRIETDMDERMSQANTVLKMAKKRAFVDGILSISGASRIFTQDVEDLIMDVE